MGDLSKKRQYIYLFMLECSLPVGLSETTNRQNVAIQFHTDCLPVLVSLLNKTKTGSSSNC